VEGILDVDCFVRFAVLPCAGVARHLLLRNKLDERISHKTKLFIWPGGLRMRWKIGHEELLSSASLYDQPAVQLHEQYHCSKLRDARGCCVKMISRDSSMNMSEA
jgi:hypothetical protein